MVKGPYRSCRVLLSSSRTALAREGRGLRSLPHRCICEPHGPPLTQTGYSAGYACHAGTIGRPGGASHQCQCQCQCECECECCWVIQSGAVPFCGLTGQAWTWFSARRGRMQVPWGVWTAAVAVTAPVVARGAADIEAVAGLPMCPVNVQSVDSMATVRGRVCVRVRGRVWPGDSVSL